jgi:hypothetical protein
MSDNPREILYLIPSVPDETLCGKMDSKLVEKASIGIGPLVLALAKTFHWAGLYGPDHPVLAKRVSEVHKALRSRLPLEPDEYLLLGIARDKVFYQNEFLGEGQDLVVRLTENLYLRQVATVGFDGRVTPEGLLSLLRYLNTQQSSENPVSPEQFLREKRIPGITLSPYNYKELLSRKLTEAQGKQAKDEGREEELWRLLLTADFANENEEDKVMEELSNSPEILQAILQRANEAKKGEIDPASGEGALSADVLKKLFGRIGLLVRALPGDTKQEVLTSLEAGFVSHDLGGGGEAAPIDLLVARSLTEGYSDDEYLELLAALLSVEGKGGERLRSVFGILAGERDIRGSLLPRAEEKARESRRMKNYYALKTWDTLEKLLLSRSEEAYLESDHANFLESVSALRASYLQQLGEKPPIDPMILTAFGGEDLRQKAILILLEFLRNERLEGEFTDILEEIRMALPNIISRKESDLLESTLVSLESTARNVRAEWAPAIREILLGTDFDQVIDLALTGDNEKSDAIRNILARFGEAAADPFLDRLLNEPEATKRRAMLKLAVTMGPALVPAIVERMTHPKWYFVRNLCIVLGEIGDRRGARALMHGVKHPDHRVKREAIKAMGKPGAGEAVPELGRVLLEENLFSTAKEDQVRIDAANALYRIGGTEAIGFIHQAKGARRKAVRSHCKGLVGSLTRTR